MVSLSDSWTPKFIEVTDEGKSSDSPIFGESLVYK